MRPALIRDIETRSTVDVGDVGIHVYARHPTTEVMCVGYALDYEPVKIWRPGQPIPKEITYAAKNSEYAFVAHGSMFETEIERNILGPKFGFPVMPAERNVCTMAMSHAVALPGALAKIARVLNLDHMKDEAGHRVMLQMSKPRKARKKEEKTQLYWFDDEERRAKLEAYCMDDVEATREILDTLPELSDDEYQVWLMDQRINDRGIFLDAQLMHASKKIINTALPSFDQEMVELTGGEVTAISQVAKLKNWIGQSYPLDTLRKGDLEELLKRTDLPPHVRRALELREQGAHAAIKKMTSLMQRQQLDGRIRGAFIYHAAGPGRWSSRGAQVHNLKRPLTKDLDAAIKVVMTGDYKYVRKVYPNPLSVIGDLVRATIKAAPGHMLIGGDFSGIEARVTAWVAGEESKLNAFRAYDRGEGPDPYIIAAAAVLHLDPMDIATRFAAGDPIAREQRQIGKACELAFGYQGGVNAFRRFSSDDSFTDEMIDRIKNAWRRAHPNISNLWSALNRAAWRVASDHRKNIDIFNRLQFECDDQPFMRIALPSGRKVSYPDTRIGNFFKIPDTGIVLQSHKKNMWSNKSGVAFKDAAAGQWRDVIIYGGFLCENIVQAISRDLLAEAMLRVERAGFAIVAHVHDECIIEAPIKNIEKSKKTFAQLMNVVPSWAEGLPIVAKPWVAERYVK